MARLRPPSGERNLNVVHSGGQTLIEGDNTSYASSDDARNLCDPGVRLCIRTISAKTCNGGQPAERY
jgi:hypothetical protein